MKCFDINDLSSCENKDNLLIIKILYLVYTN